MSTDQLDELKTIAQACGALCLTKPASKPGDKGTPVVLFVESDGSLQLFATAAAKAAKPLVKWSRDLPQVPGWYWISIPESPNTPPCIVEIAPWNREDGEPLAIRITREFALMSDIEEYLKTLWWLGPIEPPLRPMGMQ